MAWFHVQLSEAEQAEVREERECHPHPHIRQRMLALWLVHHGLTRAKAAAIVEVTPLTVQRWVASYRDGGLDGLRRWENKGNGSPGELAEHREIIRESLEKDPVRTVAEARDRIEKLTGVRRGLTRTRLFLKSLGLEWRRVRAVPVPPKKSWRSMSATRRSSTTRN